MKKKNFDPILITWGSLMFLFILALIFGGISSKKYNKKHEHDVPSYYTCIVSYDNKLDTLLTYSNGKRYLKEGGVFLAFDTTEGRVEYTFKSNESFKLSYPK